MKNDDEKMTMQQIEHLPIAGLIPYARNSRTHSPEQVAQIAASIREFGFTNPVLIDAEGGIIAGHGRVMGAQLLKIEIVPCLRLEHLTEAQKRAYVIADNKIGENSGWDDEMLALEFADLGEMGFDIDLNGFSDIEIDGHYEKMSMEEAIALADGLTLKSHRDNPGASENRTCPHCGGEI